MSLEWIKTPVSQDAACGPDLWTEDDPSYSEYYFDATGRLPEADDYVKLGLSLGEGAKNDDVIFDPNSVKLTSELASIDTLLKRTRDVRLLVLRTQWCTLAGDISKAAESVSALADLLESFPAEAHPSLADGPRDRLDALNDLGIMGAMVLPMRYLDIGGAGASRRKFMVCAGEVTPHDGEHDLSLDALQANLAARKEEVEADHTALNAMRDGLKRIENACLSAPTPHTPQFKTLTLEIDAVQKVIADANPDLTAQTEDAPQDTAAPATGSTSPGMVPAPKATEVKSHEEAKKRLIAVETYFGKNEPSSASVLLVTQARLLIGKSLVDAFETLMPNTADRAKVDFIKDNGFALAHSQLRALADQVQIDDVSEPEPAAPPPSPEPAPEPHADEAGTGDSPPPPAPPSPEPAPEAVFIVRSAAEAGVQILAVESYFRAVEKSSPVPTLLARARSYIGKDFEALLREFVPEL